MAIKRQRGIGLVSAIFIISVLAILAAGMASLVANSSQVHSQQLLDIRSQSAARSGLHIFVEQMRDHSCSTQHTDYTFNTQGLYDCQARISCQQITENSAHLMQITSNGTCGSGLDSANHEIRQYLLK